MCDVRRLSHRAALFCLLAALLLSVASLPGCVQRQVSSKSYPGFSAVDGETTAATRSSRSTREDRESRKSVVVRKSKSDPLGDIWRGFTNLFDGDEEEGNVRTRRYTQPSGADVAPDEEAGEPVSPFVDEAE